MNINEKFSPQKSLKTKYRLQTLIVHILFWLFPVLMVWMITFFDEKDYFPEAVYIVIKWSFIVLIPSFILFYFLLGLYYNSIEFKITNEEILVYRGIITRSQKIVPFRTITNIDVKIGPFDRMYGLGTIELQTAGYSAAKAGPEERMDGIPADQVFKLRELIINKVRKIKGSPGTSHDVDVSDEPIMNQILHEIKSLKQILVEKLK